MDFRNSPSSYPRGLRNNNPGNLRPSGFVYTNQIGTDSAGHAIFADIKYGLSSMAKDLMYKAYARNPRLDTIQKLINVYAPSSDGNNTNLYINYVVRETGLGKNDIMPKTQSFWLKFFDAIIKMEIGANYWAMIPKADKEYGLNEGYKKYISSLALQTGSTASNSNSLFFVLLLAGLALGVQNKKSR